MRAAGARDGETPPPPRPHLQPWHRPPNLRSPRTVPGDGTAGPAWTSSHGCGRSRRCRCPEGGRGGPPSLRGPRALPTPSSDPYTTPLPAPAPPPRSQAPGQASRPHRRCAPGLAVPEPCPQARAGSAAGLTFGAWASGRGGKKGSFVGLWSRETDPSPPSAAGQQI